MINDTAAEDLEPLSAKENLDLEARRRPRKGRLNPPYSERVLGCRTDAVAKKAEYETVQRQLEIFCDEFRVPWIMRGLARVHGRQMGHVFNDDVGALQMGLQRCVVVFYFFHTVWLGGHDARALGLVEDRVVGAIYLVASVDVSGEEPLGLAFLKDLYFVGGCVGAEHEVLVDVVAIGDGTAGVVGGEGEQVKVLVRGDEWGEGREMGVGREVGLDEGAEGAEGVVGLGVESEGEL